MGLCSKSSCWAVFWGVGGGLEEGGKGWGKGGANQEGGMTGSGTRCCIPNPPCWAWKLDTGLSACKKQEETAAALSQLSLGEEEETGPAGNSGRHFGAAAHTGAQQQRIGLPITLIQ